MIPGQTSFLQSLGWAVFNSLWQMALLWIIYQFIIAFIKPKKTSFKSSFASILLITGFSWFVYTFISAWSGATDTAQQFGFSPLLNPDGKAAGWLQTVFSFASVIYLILLIVPVLYFIRNYRYVLVIRRYGLEKMDVQWRVFVQKVAGQMNIPKKVKLWASEFVSSPVTVGFLKPVILVPLAAINHLTPQQLEAVLLHELSHIRRHDYLVNLIISFIKAVLYFNPFVKAFAKIVEREREKSCDEMVLQFQYDSHEYASALLTLEKTNHTRSAFFIAASGKKNDLLHRVELILGMPQKRSFTVNRLSGLLAAFICIFSLNTLLHVNKNLTGLKAGSFVSYSPVLRATQERETASAKKLIADYAKPAAGKLAANETAIDAAIEGPDNPDFVNAAFAAVEIPELKKYQEEQVKQTLEKSRKVFENEEWKALERNVAEVLTQKEKEELKATYHKEMSKLDWNKWENKLRMAYVQLDWSRVNEELTKAVNNIRIDSLQKVYNEAICKLDQANQELNTTNPKGIPDNGIATKVLGETKQQLRKTLTNLKALRNKKIVHL